MPIGVKTRADMFSINSAIPYTPEGDTAATLKTVPWAVWKKSFSVRYNITWIAYSERSMGIRALTMRPLSSYAKLK